MLTVAPKPAMRLAIVIPTLNEEDALSANLDRAQRAGDIVVISDGGSQDHTLEIAARLGARLVTGEPGRGHQLNRGAAAALEEGATALLFLHADTCLPRAARQLVQDALDGGAVGGGFSVRFDSPRPIFGLGARIVNLRTRLLRAPLGDQAQFVGASVYRSLGGFQNWPILEDVDFIRRLRRRGRVAILGAPVTTSTRRFTERGIGKTIAINWLIWGLFLLGVKPERLARLYPQIR